MSLTGCKGDAVDVEVAKKKTLLHDKREERPDENQLLPNVVVLMVMIVTVAGISIYTYRVALRVHHLEQHIEVMSHRCGSSARPEVVTPRSRTDGRHQTSGTSTTSSPPSTTSVSSTSSLIIDQDPVNDIDERLKSGDYPQVGSGVLDEYDDDDDEEEDDDAEELSGDGSSHESYELMDKWPAQFSSYDQFYSRRRKRSVAEPPTPTTRRRQHQQQQQQQQQQHSRRRSGYRSSSDHDSSSRQHARMLGDERRHHRERTERRRQRSHADTLEDDTAVDRTQSSGLKAAHFYAPRGPNKHHVSGSVPPATLPFWRADNWTVTQGHWFSLNDGIVTILQSGLYLIYAQLVYHDLSGRWSFGIYVNDNDRVKCMNTEQIDAGRHHRASSSHGVYQHCYTSTVLKLSRYESVSIRCLYGSRSVVMQPEFTFWGLVQLTG